jgi:hypothetical protein
MRIGPFSPGAGLKAVLTVTAVVLFALGGGLLAAPRAMATLYGAAVSAEGTNAARTAGAAIFALGVLAWLSRGESRDGSGALGVRVLFVWFVLKSVVAYLAVIHAVFDPFVGKTVLFSDVLLAVIYGYYLVSLARVGRGRRESA